MLHKISEFYDQEVEATTESLTALIEPLMIAVLGGLVGSMIIALYMPIFKIFNLINSPRKCVTAAAGQWPAPPFPRLRRAGDSRAGAVVLLKLGAAADDMLFVIELRRPERAHPP